MIKEISNFIESIDPDYFTSDINPAPGLHIKLDIDENKQVVKESYQSFAFNKKGQCFEKDDGDKERIVECNEDFAKYEYVSAPVTINKALDFSRKLHSASPYILWFKKEVIELAKSRLQEYYKTANKFINDDAKKLFDNISHFSQTELFNLIKNDTKFKLIKGSDYIKIYFNVPFEIIINAYNNYLSERIYVKDDYNIADDNDEILGLSGFLNGANRKKIYMMHKTSRFNVNNRITQKDAINLFRFEKLLKSKPRKLPNPFPLFIEKEELNNEVIRLYSREGVVNFHNIIKELFAINRGNDITNYYLINWSNTKTGIVLNDLDFVPSFEYKLDGMVLSNPMQIKDISDNKINNVFQFEIVIVQKIFNNTLIVKTKNGNLLLKYFDEVDSNYCSKTTYQNILNYRKNFYDFIYKSRREAITQTIFYKIVISEILDEIKRNGDFAKTYGIKEKLNILFSINKFFDKTNKNFGGLNMSSIIPEYLTQLKEIITDDEKHLPDNDNFFAFAAGQLIYYIIFQSQSANRTHALLEPYISKNDPNQFKIMITRGIEQFKHSLNFGYTKFEKLASEVLGYNCEKEIKSLLPIILAGYFSNCLLLEKKTTNS